MYACVHAYVLGVRVCACSLEANEESFHRYIITRLIIVFSWILNSVNSFR